MPPLSKISQAPEKEPALDPTQLFSLGMEHVRRLSANVWTDHNIHDPGITILELATYALTELAYRAEFPIEDLLTDQLRNPASMEQNFFRPDEVLPNSPLTVTDYRKLLIDLKGVQNAWILPRRLTYYANTHTGQLQRNEVQGNPEVHPVEIHGISKVLIEFESSVNHDQREAIQIEIRKTLQANRNLCEDFGELSAVGDQWYSLCSEIELQTNADADEVAATMLFRLERYLNPRIKRYRLAEILARRDADGNVYTLPDVFEGPLLKDGFIDDQELAASDLRTEIRLSDLINVAMNVKGVLAVRDMILNQISVEAGHTTELPFATPDDKWKLNVPEGKRPLLTNLYTFGLLGSRVDQTVTDDLKKAKADSGNCTGRLLFYKRQMPLKLNTTRVQEFYQQLQTAEDVRPVDVQMTESRLPIGRFRDPSRYYSFQNHFPTVYGLSKAGLSLRESLLRQTQALQLKGYLLFFDQVMANFLAQLSHVGELFSRSDSESRTYFGQAVDSFRDWRKLYPDSMDQERIEDLVMLLNEGIRTDQDFGNLIQQNQDPVKRQEALQDAAYQAGLERRSRLVDHLLARCGEDFHHYVNIMRSAFEETLTLHSTISTRYAFLRDFPQLARDRGKAYDQSLPASIADPWQSNNVSGFERRLCRLLGIGNSSRRPLSAVSFQSQTEVEQNSDGKFEVRIKHPLTQITLLSSPAQFDDAKAAAAEAKRIIDVGSDLANYRKQPSADGKSYFFEVRDQHNKLLSPGDRTFPSSAARDDAIGDQVAHLRSYYSGEGLYLIESLLLRPDDAKPEVKVEPGAPPDAAPPQDESGLLLPICVDWSCPDCSDFDPYSFRLHVLLPVFAGRFRNEAFRDFVEETIRVELPAHILPRICWIDAGHMDTFEEAYQDWLVGPTTKPGDDKVGATSDTILKNLIRELYQVHNVYDKTKIPDCKALDDQNPPFILGRSHLGEPKPPVK